MSASVRFPYTGNNQSPSYLVDNSPDSLGYFHADKILRAVCFGFMGAEWKAKRDEAARRLRASGIAIAPFGNRVIVSMDDFSHVARALVLMGIEDTLAEAAASHMAAHYNPDSLT